MSPFLTEMAIATPDLIMCDHSLGLPDMCRYLGNSSSGSGRSALRSSGLFPRDSGTIEELQRKLAATTAATAGISEIMTRAAAKAACILHFVQDPNSLELTLAQRGPASSSLQHDQ